MSRPNFPEREEQILKFWEENKIFEQTLNKTSTKGPFVFFEGPPTANGRPGIHHVEARAFKDLMPRFKTMQGYHVDRKAGWDTHGLPVELEVEKKLGFSGKKDIEAYGIAAFNEECKKSVWNYLEDWQKITKRIGFWVDMEHPYVTYDPKYVESLWAIVKQIWDKNLLYKDYKVVPYCPRCGTALSSHELAQGYKDVKDISVFAKFKMLGEENTYFVAWTTTPWTLPGNVALAVGPQIDYVKIRVGTDNLWLAKARLEIVKEPYEILEEAKGEALTGREYEPLYPYIRDAIVGTDQADKKGWYVVPADFVSTTDGSGIVHTAVMYGQDDFELGNKVGLPKHHLVKLDGTFVDGMDQFSGRFVTDEDVAVDVIKDLAHRGLLFGKEKYEHSYPHCWRCKTKLVYYAKDSWYIRMSSLRSELIAANESVHWEPEHIKDGRFGEWLREVKDWAFSRERYWGTPLPIWECQECGDKTCIGSFAELREKSLSELGAEIDPHRPFVDEIDVKCGKCGGASKRVSEVCDVWFDSGCMPYAQWHYPFENAEKIDNGQAFPADYISEAIDQTRGWFYTLLAVSVLLGKGAPYKNVICLGHLLDANGKKMSKSLGNIVDPNEMIAKYGADALRWYMYTVTQPGDSKRFDEKSLNEMIQKVFMILWNVKAFYEMYAESTPKEVKADHVLDRWILAKLNVLVKDTTENLEKYIVTETARNIGEFINDLSTWFVRRSRDRMKDGEGVVVLREVLLTLAKLMAPFTPFLAEALYQDLSGGKKSVHLEEWPVADASLIDETVLKDMASARLIVSAALERRADAGLNVRQALAGMTVGAIRELPTEYEQIIKDEVNVKTIEWKKADQLVVELDTTLTPELIRDGLAREIIRQGNAARKEAGLTIDDRIKLTIKTLNVQVTQTFEEHKAELLDGTRADEAVVEVGSDDDFTVTIKKI